MAGVRFRPLGTMLSRLITLKPKSLPKVTHTPSPLTAVRQFLHTEGLYLKGAAADLKNDNVTVPFLQRIPLASIIWANMNISFLSASIVKLALRNQVSSDIIDDHPFFWKHLDPGALLNEKTFWRAWGDINLLWLGATTFFAGIDGFFPRQSEFRKHGLDTWIDKRVAGFEKWVPTFSNGIRALFVKINPSLPDYAREMVLRGSIGATEMAGIRNPEILTPMTKLKDALTSKPVERGLNMVVGGWAPDNVIRGVARAPDGFLNFVGEITPHKRGALIGFGIDITANTALDVSGALLFSNGTNFYNLLVPGFIISMMIGYANTRISQSQGIFSSSQKLLHRAHLGILKTAFYRGPYGSGVVTQTFGLLIQGAYGLWALAHANRITQPRPLELYSPEVLARIQQARQSGSFTVATLDSGLGGLSVFADTYTRLERGPFLSTRNFFINAQSGPELGFNTQPTLADKARQLDHVLREATAKFQPDLIVLACHTMSLLFPHTEFAKQHGPHVPTVLDVMRASVELMVSAISHAPESQLVVMSTPAIAESGEYQRRLQERHVREDRIFAEASPELTTSIQNDPSGETTLALIDRHVDRVWQMLSDKGRLAEPVLVALNCSQYVFVAGVIHDAFARRGLDVRIINPAHELMAGLFEKSEKRAEQTEPVTTEAAVYSAVPVHQQLGAFLADISKGAAKALDHIKPANGLALPQPVAQ